ncbi:DUF262 domain-containing protein [Ensifer sp. Root558]|uniref:DUF262 domain-containing protein n=1 Tax=Ensifer sp. Root558 TaxID=1736558 RepID=UPI0009EC6205|nr:DUF262 domain-containing protein [Ensifer sp. Root558]
MAYASTTIARAVGQINRSYFLPAIQRPYVWHPDQIVSLFDSLMKGYPISSFLFWQVEPSRRDDWDIYKFMENFRQGNVHNELAEADGRDITLILDGQQRLTSLLIGLQGSYTVRRKYARRGSPDNWVRQNLYLDLLKDAAVEASEDADNQDIGITYGFKFSSTTPPAAAGHMWMKVGRILDCTSDDKFDALLTEIEDTLPETATRAESRRLQQNLNRLYRMVWRDEVVSYFTETDQSYDRVLDIFIRANDGGTKLSKSDLLLSMITSKWNGVSAREEIFGFVNHLNTGLQGKNNVDKDLVMKACLLLSDLDHVYKVGNFTTRNLAIIEKNWGEIKRVLEATFNLINRFGIDQDTLTSGNAILPIAYYLFKTGQGDLSASTPEDARNSSLIQRWLIGVLINGVFGGTSDNTIGAARAIVKDKTREGKSFPYKELVDGLALRGRLTELNDSNIDSFLDTTYGRQTCFLALSLLYDTTTWGLTNYHIDHIIPRSLVEPKVLRSGNVPETVIERIQESVNRLGNLQLLRGQENLEKSNQPFDQWIHTRDEGFRDRHLIPGNEGLYNILQLPRFVKERERLIVKHLKQTIFSHSDLSMGEPDLMKDAHPF